MSLVGLTSAASLDNLVLPLTIGDIFLAQAGLSQGDGANKLLFLSSGRHLTRCHMQPMQQLSQCSTYLEAQAACMRHHSICFADYGLALTATHAHIVLFGALPCTS